MTVTYEIFDITLMDVSTKTALTAAGGTVYVAQPGAARKATLYDPDNNYAALSNPITPKNGRIRFALSTGVSGQALPQTADIYGMSAGGLCFVYRGIAPGSPDTVFLDVNDRDQILIVPFSILDTTANTETSTGFNFPANCLVGTPPAVTVRTAEATRTLSAGILSSQSGGSATGFMTGVSLATAGISKSTLSGTGTTIGAFLYQTNNSTKIPEPYPVAAGSQTLSYTLSASTAQADGFLVFQYQLTS